MNARFFASIAVAVCMFGTVWADYDCQTSVNSLGDWHLVTVGGYTFAKPFSFDFSPTNAPLEGVRYSVRCQVIYQDKAIPRPMTELDLGLARNTGRYLNAWLKDFMTAAYAGVEFSDLRQQYLAGRVTDDLNEKFPAYVAGRIAEMEPSLRPDVDTVTVTVEAEGAFKAELVERFRSESES